MKRILYLLYIVGILLGAASCADDLGQQNAPTVTGDKVRLSFNVSVPDEQEIVTRSVDEDGWGLQTLWLFCFDADGVFIGRSQATLSGDVLDAERGITATVSSRTRIVHLLANQNLDGVFVDNNNLGVHENTVMTGLTSTSNAIVYWGRVDYSSADTPEAFATAFQGTDILMFRNQAALTYDATDLPNGLTVEGFAVCNYYTNGTSVPFNSADAKFDWANVWRSAPYVTTPLSHLKASDPTDTDTETPKCIYESPNTGEDESYLIFKLSVNNGQPAYYKVALIDENKDPLPIYRNYRYTVHFSAAPSTAGSADFETAKSAAPLNNAWVSVDASIPSIGNSTEGVLTIKGETTVIYETGGEKTLNYTYTGNKTPVVSWVTDDGVAANEVLNHTFANGQGTIRFTANAMTGNEVHRATLQVKAGPLVRYIKIVTVRQFSFDPVWCSSGIYNGKSLEDVAFTFVIPESYPTELFPLRCLISTAELSGNGVIPLDVIYPINEDGTENADYGDDNGLGYKYVYMAEAAGVQRIYFQTNYTTDLNTTPTGTILLEAEHFTPVTKTYAFTDADNRQLIIANAAQYKPNLGESDETVVYYQLVEAKKGSEVTLNLRYGNGMVLPSGVNVMIYTSNLEPVGDGFTRGESSYDSGTYWYYTTTGSEDNLTFKTLKANSAEVVRFATTSNSGSGGDFKSCSIELANYRNWTFNLASTPAAWEYGTARDVQISFDVKEFMSASQYPDQIPDRNVYPGEDFWVYITTQHLEAAENSGKTLEKTDDGYRYLVKEADKVSGRVTLNFKTNKIVNAEEISIHTDAEEIAFTSEKLTVENTPLTGRITYGDGGSSLPAGAFVTLERKDGTRIGSVSLTTGNGYSIRLRGEFNFGWNEQVFVKYKASDGNYEAETTLEELYTNKTVSLTKQ